MVNVGVDRLYKLYCPIVVCDVDKKTDKVLFMHNGQLSNSFGAFVEIKIKILYKRIHFFINISSLIQSQT